MCRVEMERIAYIIRGGVVALSLLMATALFAQSEAEKGTHIVAQGETLYRISQMYGTSVEQLLKLNPEAKDGIHPGQVLQLPQPEGDTEETFHLVQTGETLYGIARRYFLSTQEILKANPQIKKESEIAAGMIIRIPSAQHRGKHRPIQQSPTEYPEEKDSDVGQGQQGLPIGLKLYIVPRGATIYSILKITGWTEAELLHHNPQLKEAGPKAGDTLLIPDPESALHRAEDLPDSSGIALAQLHTVVLALPFAEDQGQRFQKYYEGVLMALLEAKQAGQDIALYVVDCSASELEKSLVELRRLSKIDLLIGGVSQSALNQLSRVAEEKGATFVIPFTSRSFTGASRSGLQIFQINTPHNLLYQSVAEKFVQTYRGHRVEILTFEGDQGSKIAFIEILKGALKRAGIPYRERSTYQLATPEAVAQLARQSEQPLVVVPSSSSFNAANNTLTPIALATDSLGVHGVTAFGYPEWQTYLKALRPAMQSSEATFFTTFFTDPSAADYRSFEKAFRGWYGHALGGTFPRYGLLGYDTARFFLTRLGLPPQRYREPEAGMQSSFHFKPHPSNRLLMNNHALFFVQQRRDSSQLKF